MKRSRITGRADFRDDFDEPFQRHSHDRQLSILRCYEVPDEASRDGLAGAT